jgi:hypothetical protein
MPNSFIFHSKKVREDEGREYTWCWSIKYWEEKSITHSFVDSQFCELPFNWEIDECVSGLNFCIMNQDLGMAISTFKHYRLHEGGISYPTQMLRFWILSRILFSNHFFKIQEETSPTFSVKKWNLILH